MKTHLQPKFQGLIADPGISTPCSD